MEQALHILVHCWAVLVGVVCKAGRLFSMVRAAFSPEPCRIWNLLAGRIGVYPECMMNRTFSVAGIALLALTLGPAKAGAQATPHDQLVAKHAAAHGVPEALVRRVIQIESRSNPRAVSAGNYGLMQIRLGTARAMGYRGDARGLLDADTNMTYAVRYLAGAYRAARGNQAQAIRNYQRGYYYTAKAQGFSPYTLASATQQTAAPDPAMLEQEAARRQAVEQQQAVAQQRIAERQAAEHERAAQRQAALQARIEQRKAAEAARVAQRQAAQQERIARQQAVEQQRIAQRQAMHQQRLEREKAREQQRVEREQARVQRQIERQQRHSAAFPPTKRAAVGSSYAWYNPMRYFKHPSHQAHHHARQN
jgi:hypothetical protein